MDIVCVFNLAYRWLQLFEKIGHLVIIAIDLLTVLAIFQDEDMDPLLSQACRKLVYQVHLVKWCLDKAR